MAATDPRPPRKDVARNRQKLLDSARVLFAERGLEVSLDDIARHAGVGAGTAYRHFGSRHEIISAIFSDAVGEFVMDAERSLAMADPWTGFVAFVEAFARRQAEDRGLHQVFAGNHGTTLHPDGWAAVLEAIAAITTRAQASGTVRSDIDFTDLVALFITLGPLYDISSTTATPIWRRQVDIFLRGVRPDTATTGIVVPPALTIEQLGDVISAETRGAGRAEGRLRFEAAGSLE
jgi:AcrR family transcriptional regulator